MSTNKEGSVCQRYHMRGNRYGDYDEVPDDDGEWVKATDYEALCAEMDRLTARLAKANEQTEDYERRYYLALDRAEAAEARVARLITDGNRLDSAMDMQEKRETGEFHLSQPAAKAVWVESRQLWCAALNDQGQGSSEASK